MEGIVSLLQSSDIKSRLLAGEQLSEKLRQKSAVEYLPTDLKKRVLNAVLTLAKENHVKLCLTGLECLQTLVEIHTEAFSSYMNMTFDTIVTKFADVKVSFYSYSLSYNSLFSSTSSYSYVFCWFVFIHLHSLWYVPKLWM